MGILSISLMRLSLLYIFGLVVAFTYCLSVTWSITYFLKNDDSFQTLKGVNGNTCESFHPDTCHELLYAANLFSMNGFPTVQQIQKLCPSLKAYLDCVDEYERECDFDDFGIFSSEREFVGVHNFILDFCDEDSPLYKQYADNVDCLLSVNENMTECNRVAETIYTDYAEFKRNHIPERDEPYTANNALCVSKSYSVMCAVLKTLTHCGTEAYGLMIQLVNRSNILHLFCKKVELHDLQTTFLDYLAIDEEHRDQLSRLFKL